MRQLHRFHGGVHPPTNKTQSSETPILAAAMPSKLVIPLHQHVGNIARPVVSVGEHVLKGQVIGKADGRLSSAVHASTSGTITAINYSKVAHPSGMDDLCVTLIPDGKDEWVENLGVDYRELSHSDIRHRLRDAGVVGLGGAVFPSDMKLYSSKHQLKTLVLNGAECEPYITCDDRLMRERAEEILLGAEMMRDLLHAEEVVVGIEDNKPEALAAMQKAIIDGKHERMEAVAVPTVYPGGGAKQLIRVLTGIEVAAGVRSTEKGVQCFNVATAYSAYRAISYGEPMLSRVVTVTGNVERPQNYEVLLGTPVAELVAQAGLKSGTNGYLMGGPMMGFMLPSDQVGVVKATNCIIATAPESFPAPAPTMPCIRCTRCAEVCPAELQPQELHWFAKAKEFGKAQDYHLFDCIECGACSYVCPSNIPLVQYYRYAKSEIWARERDKRAADLARERHEYRQFRIEREKQEKAEKLAQKERAALLAKQQADAAAATTNTDEDAQARIQSAMARVQAQHDAVQPRNTDNLTPEQQAKINEIEARRAHIQELAHPEADLDKHHEQHAHATASAPAESPKE
ncbi:Electron transport complex subunit RsxC [Ferriphaselus amnicola]|uniref:Ion-translocating oxidoreductase complex subunit C n=1 Tax=Ferriphaselus amnicola TaxID=1188319 RepID=A0A2Z6GF08_9PROT|nr:electron transport complex subunit RsxC [Ferriphaselus amnicola]BBE51715.1 Electron transport complex subunit RsxC [Ferriphaselus amnicola]